MEKRCPVPDNIGNAHRLAAFLLRTVLRHVLRPGAVLPFNLPPCPCMIYRKNGEVRRNVMLFHVLRCVTPCHVQTEFRVFSNFGYFLVTAGRYSVFIAGKNHSLSNERSSFL